MRVLRPLLRVLGWLLTPLVAWAASFVGSLIGSMLGGGRSSARGALWLTLGFGALFALTAAWAWLRLLRRSPKLQQTLAVAPDGTPLAALDQESSSPPLTPPGA
ncbi:MAG: hypothetical protein ACRENB_08885 [Gemmatimonadales bacterium]